MFRKMLNYDDIESFKKTFTKEKAESYSESRFNWICCLMTKINIEFLDYAKDLREPNWKMCFLNAFYNHNKKSMKYLFTKCSIDILVDETIVEMILHVIPGSIDMNDITVNGIKRYDEIVKTNPISSDLYGGYFFRDGKMIEYKNHLTLLSDYTSDLEFIKWITKQCFRKGIYKVPMKLRYMIDKDETAVMFFMYLVDFLGVKEIDMFDMNVMILIAEYMMY